MKLNFGWRLLGWMVWNIWFQVILCLVLTIVAISPIFLWGKTIWTSTISALLILAEMLMFLGLTKAEKSLGVTTYVARRIAKINPERQRIADSLIQAAHQRRDGLEIWYWYKLWREMYQSKKRLTRASKKLGRLDLLVARNPQNVATEIDREQAKLWAERLNKTLKEALTDLLGFERFV